MSGTLLNSPKYCDNEGAMDEPDQPGNAADVPAA